MSSLALMEIQRALYARLSADAILMGMVSGLYDAVPQTSDLPYVVIGDGAQVVQAADGLTVSECQLILDVWTDASGRKTALTILNRLHALLHLGTLALSGFELLVLRVERANTALREEATHIHGVITVVVTVAEV